MSEAVQTSTAKERREEDFLLDRLRGKPLAKHEQKGYVKREPRFLLEQKPGPARRGQRPRARLPFRIIVYDPDPPLMGRGQLLFSVRRR